MKGWESFLEKYTAFGQQPTTERYVALFDPECTLRHPGMAKPIGISEIPDFIDRAMERLPQYHLIPTHWAVNRAGDTIFVEARNTAMVGDEQIVWPATYVITLRGDRVLRGRAYYDRSEVYAHFEPSLATSGANAHITLLEDVQPGGSPAADTEAYAAQVYERIVVPYVENWKHPQPQRFRDFYASDARMINPGFERPLGPAELEGYYSDLMSQIPDLRLRLEEWAVATGLLFCEWTATGHSDGKPMELPVTDRFTLSGMLAAEGVAYFDALGLRAQADPKMASFADGSIGAASVSR